MVSCRWLPHGYYGLVVAIIASLGWVASLSRDRCNYSIVTADRLISSLTSSTTGGDASSIPYIEVGLDSYRVPSYDPSTETWNIDPSQTCISYYQPSSSDTAASNSVIDSKWKLSKLFTFMALVMGGGGALYLWISSCCLFSRGSWRWAGIEVLLACIFQGASFVWFRTSICTDDISASTATAATMYDNIGEDTAGYRRTINDFFQGLTTTSCALSDGSISDIFATCLWFIAALLIFMYYPKPKEMDEENNDGIIRTNTNDEYDSNGSVTRSMVSSSNGSIDNNKDNESSTRTIRSTRSTRTLEMA